MSYNDLRKGRVSEHGREYLITVVTAGREPLFEELTPARLLIRQCQRLEQEHHVRWLTWVLMPDHFHGLLTLNQPPLSKAIGVLKGRSARVINEALQRRGAVWQPGFHDRALRKEDDRLAIARYILANPLRAGLVEDLGAYSHWDAIWLDPASG